MVAKGGFTIGPSHAEGGIPMTVKSTGQKIEVEGGEGIINKRSMADNRRFRVEGTPKQIASAINEIDGNGVQFDSGAKISKLEHGGMLLTPYVSDRYLKNRNRYDFYLDNEDGMENIGFANVSPNYKNPNVLKIDKIHLNEDYQDSKVFLHYVQSMIDKSKNQAAVIKVSCLDDDCFGEMLEIGELDKRNENLYIK